MTTWGSEFWGFEDATIITIATITSCLIPIVGWAVASWGLMDRFSRQHTETPSPNLLGLSVVMISDTHGRHRDVAVPTADILIHAGDFTHFGKRQDAEDFNAWLTELPHQHKIVVNGNHEHNADWKHQVRPRYKLAVGF